jgi:hypothetical protein
MATEGKDPVPRTVLPLTPKKFQLDTGDSKYKEEAKRKPPSNGLLVSLDFVPNEATKNALTLKRQAHLLE